MENSKIIKYQWLIIAVIILLISLLIFQNINLKLHPPHVANQMSDKMQAVAFEQNLEKKFQYRKFPIEVKPDGFFFYDKYKRNFVNTYLIMVFDFTVCGKCLYEELEVLKHFKEKLEEKNIQILAYVGTAGKSEEATVIELEISGEIFFPCKIIPADSIYTTFQLSKDKYIDTPFYVYTTHQFQVLDIFKPLYLKTKEFKTWLTILANQDSF